MSNLGWEVWSVNFRGRLEDNAEDVVRGLTFDQCIDDLKSVIGAAGPKAVLTGHSLGGIAAMKAAEGENLSALILVSPPLFANESQTGNRVLYLLRLKYYLPVLLRLPVRIREIDFSCHWLSSIPGDRREGILSGLVAESSDLVRRLLKPEADLHQTSVQCPTLVLAGQDDRVAPIEAVRQWTQMSSAEVKEYPGHGHWMLAEEGWEEIVNDLHRWAVQRLGESILLAEFPAKSEL